LVTVSGSGIITGSFHSIKVAMNIDLKLTKRWRLVIINFYFDNIALQFKDTKIPARCEELTRVGLANRICGGACPCMVAQFE
jgi:hypothetical protein